MKIVFSLCLSLLVTTFSWANNNNEVSKIVNNDTITKIIDKNAILRRDVVEIVNEINTPNNGKNARVEVSPAIMTVLNKSFSSTKMGDGFRIQIYSSNRGTLAKNTAFEIEKKILELDPNTKVYVSYETPFWKVRLGNCGTKDEAIDYRKYVILKFPDFAAETYIVPSEIEVN